MSTWGCSRFAMGTSRLRTITIRMGYRSQSWNSFMPVSLRNPASLFSPKEDACIPLKLVDAYTGDGAKGSHALQLLPDQRAELVADLLNNLKPAVPPKTGVRLNGSEKCSDERVLPWLGHLACRGMRHFAWFTVASRSSEASHTGL